MIEINDAPKNEPNPVKNLPEKSKRLFSQDDFWDQIFYRIGEGQSLREVSKYYKIPYTTIHDRIHSDEGGKLKYLEALTSRAMHHASRIEEIALMVEQGNIEPQAAKVAIDARKWIASRFHPRQFSEKLFEIKKTEEKSLSKMHLEELRKLMKTK